MLHQVARELPEHDCVFTPFYADGLLGRLASAGLLDFTILGGQARRRTLAYITEQGLPLDLAGGSYCYDLVLMGTDLVLPRNVSGRRLVLVQEGMTDPEDVRYRLVRRLRLPRYFANTSMTGLSDAYDRFCVASDGYRELVERKGVRREKLVVTGIPNFDNAAASLHNNFPHRNYVLAATSCLRETLKYENRRRFIRWALEVAGRRRLFFKLHPNENVARAAREIGAWAPEAAVFTDANVEHMIANCSALVTRYSSVVYHAVALGREVHAATDLATRQALVPLQNGGRSARHIADVCRELLN